MSTGFESPICAKCGAVLRYGKNEEGETTLICPKCGGKGNKLGFTVISADGVTDGVLLEDLKLLSREE